MEIICILTLNYTISAKFIDIRSDAFKTEVLKVWYEDNLTSTENLLPLSLWQSSLVRIGNKPIYRDNSWSSKRIQKVRQFMKDADNLHHLMASSASGQDEPNRAM